MREILFRARTLFDVEWVEGYYEFGYDAETEEPTHYMWVLNHAEKYGEMFMVVPETVGQYTGLTDKNGTKIFEGDIVKATFSHNNWMQDSVEKRTATYEVRYNEKYCYFYLAKRQNNMLFDGNWTYALREIEVIGNIHDNPELLEGGAK